MNFAGKRTLQLVPYGLRVVPIPAVEIHQFCDGCFDRAVAPADDPGPFQLIARIIAFHFDKTGHTLADIDDRNAALGRFLQNVYQPRLLWCVPASETSHDDTFQFGGIKSVFENISLNAGEKGKHHDVRIHAEMRYHRFGEVGLQDVVLQKMEIDAGFTQMLIIERVEGIKAVGISLCRTVPS